MIVCTAPTAPSHFCNYFPPPAGATVLMQEPVIANDKSKCIKPVITSS